MDITVDDVAPLFSDRFEVTAVNPDGKVFDRVKRLAMKGDTFEHEVLVDINSEVFKVGAGDRIQLRLQKVLRGDQDEDPGVYNATCPALLNQFHYAMFGKVFNIVLDKNDSAGHAASVYVSFGGLLMRLRGDGRRWNNIEKGMTLYCLMRKE